MIAFHLDGESRMFLASSMLNVIFEGALIGIKADFNSFGRRNTGQALYLELLAVRAQDFGIVMVRDEKGCLLDLSRSYQHHLHLPSTPPLDLLLRLFSQFCTSSIVVKNKFEIGQ